jgi:hypothetical protein
MKTRFHRIINQTLEHVVKKYELPHEVLVRRFPRAVGIRVIVVTVAQLYRCREIRERHHQTAIEREWAASVGDPTQAGEREKEEGSHRHKRAYLAGQQQ